MEVMRTSRCRYESNIRKDLDGRRVEGFDWIQLAKDRSQLRDVVNTSNEHAGSMKDGEYPDRMTFTF
jgi:hypothetical protein